MHRVGDLRVDGGNGNWRMMEIVAYVDSKSFTGLTSHLARACSLFIAARCFPLSLDCSIVRTYYSPRCEIEDLLDVAYCTAIQAIYNFLFVPLDAKKW